MKTFTKMVPFNPNNSAPAMMKVRLLETQTYLELLLQHVHDDLVDVNDNPSSINWAAVCTAYAVAQSLEQLLTFTGMVPAVAE